MKPEIPTAQFKEEDATKLIASYGVKPPPLMKEKLEEALRNHREQFLSQERSKTRTDSERSH